MMNEFRLWLFRIVIISVICSVAEELMPSGAVKRVGKLVCGLMILWVMLSPVVELMAGLNEEFEVSYYGMVEEYTQQLERQTEEKRKTIIEERYAAYIVDKAATLGVNCTAEVECRLGEEGLYLPEYARIAGPFSDVAQSRMTQLLEEELELPMRRQEYIFEEEPA